MIFQFSDQLEGMMSTLQGTADQANKAGPISAHPDKLREQMADNESLKEDLERRLSPLQALTTSASDLMNREGMDEETAKGSFIKSFVGSYACFFALYGKMCLL